MLAVAAFVALPWITARSKTLLWAWLAGGLAYVFVVVTVERVDYYLYPLFRSAPWSSAGCSRALSTLVRGVDAAPAARYALVALVPLAALSRS